MTGSKSNTKRLLILLAIILGIILIVAIVVGVRSTMQNVKTLRPNRLSDRGWEAVTPILDQGGVGLFTSDQKGYLVVGRGEQSDAEDLRDYCVHISDRRENDGRTMYINLVSAEDAEGQRGYEVPNEYNRPIAIYEFKLRDADRIELRIDDVDQAFTQILDVANGSSILR